MDKREKAGGRETDLSVSLTPGCRRVGGTQSNFCPGLPLGDQSPAVSRILTYEQPDSNRLLAAVVVSGLTTIELSVADVQLSPEPVRLYVTLLALTTP